MPVVIGVDGSEGSMRAVEWAARETGAQEVAAPDSVRPRPAAADAVAVRASGPPGLSIETDLLSGPPAVTVADCGHGASMLVLGARGSGGMMLGSVSRYGAAHAPCPVVVVREETTAVQREVAVGIRNPEDAQGALDFAFEEAALRDAELLVVHAWYSFPLSLRAKADPAFDPELISANARGQLTDMLAAWREKYPPCRPPGAWCTTMTCAPSSEY